MLSPAEHIRINFDSVPHLAEGLLHCQTIRNVVNDVITMIKVVEVPRTRGRVG